MFSGRYSLISLIRNWWNDHKTMAMPSCHDTAWRFKLVGGRFPNRLSGVKVSLWRASTLAIFLLLNLVPSSHETFQQSITMKVEASCSSWINIKGRSVTSCSLDHLFLLPSCVLSWTNLKRKNNFCFPCNLLSLLGYLDSRYDGDFHCCALLFVFLSHFLQSVLWLEKTEKNAFSGCIYQVQHWA